MKTSALLAGLLLAAITQAQDHTITQWNFNSQNPDGSINTGTLIPSIGIGTIDSCGTVEFTFASGTSNGGSGDEAVVDNSALNTSHYPSQGNGDTSSGIIFWASLFGYQDIKLQFDIRLSSTASRNLQLSISTDSGNTWLNASLFVATQAGSTWYNGFEINLSSFPELNDHPHALFKLVTTVEPGTGSYEAVGATSNYSPAGTIRYDRLTIKGIRSALFTDLEPPILLSCEPINSNRILLTFNEAIDSLTAKDANNYSGIPGVFQLSCLQTDSGVYLVELVFPSGYPQGEHLELVISGIADTAGNSMLVAARFPIFMNASLPKLVITEIMYNNPGTDDYEYLEIYNNSDEPVQLEGFYFSGITHVFENPTLLAGNDYLLLAKNKTLAKNAFNVEFEEWDSGSLTNSGECISLLNQLGEEIDQVCYDNTGNWPKDPNGNGPSLELINPNSDNANSENWRAAFVLSGGANGENYSGSPGFGYEENKISFKSGDFSFTEGIGRIKIPLTVKMKGSKPTWIIIKVKPESEAIVDIDFTANTFTYKVTAGSTNYVELELIDDHVYEGQEKIILEISALCNGTSIGFTSTEIEIIDNDYVLPVLCFSEWMPQNRQVVLDDAGDYDPWIELYNPNTYSIGLSNYLIKVTNEVTGLFTMQRLPAQSIAPDEYLIFYTDSQAFQGFKHLNIFLPKKRGKIELIAIDSLTVISSRSYPTSLLNKSIGTREPCGDSTITFQTPTPQAPWDAPSGLEENKFPTFRLHPNPILSGNIELPGINDYYLYSLSGQLISVHPNTTFIDTTNLASGTYVIGSKTKYMGTFSKP